MVDKKLIAESATPTPSEVRLRQSSSPLPLLGMGKEIVASSTVVNPPGPPWKDRTSPDSDRFRDRNKPSKDKLPDIIRNNPIFGDKGKVKVPIDGGYEPRWRPGRDGKGGAGGGGPKPGEDPEDLTYIELTYEEFLKLFFEGLNLPFMLKKMLAQTEVVSFKRRGITNHGPKARLNKMESAKARLKRAVVMKNAHPEEFIENFEGQCQAVFEAYLYHAAILSGVEPFVGEPDYSVLDDVDFCNQVAFIAGLADQSREDEFRAAVLLAADLYRKTAGEGRVPYKLNEIV